MDLTPEDLEKLWRNRVRVLASADNDIWRQEGGLVFANRAYLTSAPESPVMLPQGSLIFLPEYPKDFESHPAAYKSLEMLYWGTSKGIKPIQIEAYRLFFLVTPKQGAKFLEGALNRYSFSEGLRRGLR